MRLLRKKGVVPGKKVPIPPRGEEEEREERRSKAPSQTYEDVIVVLRQQLDAAKNTIEQMGNQQKSEAELSKIQAAVIQGYEESKRVMDRFSVILEKIHVKKIDTYETTIRTQNMEIETLVKERNLLRDALARIKEIKVGAA
jgi:hypothetical protein